MIKWKLVWHFYLTLLIPLLYLYNILIIASYSNTMLVNGILRLFALLIAFLGLLIWSISMINLKTSFGVLPQKQKRIKSGLYKYFNHPMYIGIYLAFIGLSVANASSEGIMFTCLFMTPLLFLRAYLEDKKLAD